MSETFKWTCPMSTRGSIGSLMPRSLVGRGRRLRNLLRELLGALQGLVCLDLGVAEPLLRTGFLELRLAGLVLALSIGGSGSGSGGAGSGGGCGSGSGGSGGGVGACGSITVTGTQFPRRSGRNSSRASPYARTRAGRSRHHPPRPLLAPALRPRKRGRSELPRRRLRRAHGRGRAQRARDRSAATGRLLAPARGDRGRPRAAAVRPGPRRRPLGVSPALPR